MIPLTCRVVTMRAHPTRTAACEAVDAEVQLFSKQLLDVQTESLVALIHSMGIPLE
jgi:hypothetical protein